MSWRAREWSVRPIHASPVPFGLRASLMGNGRLTVDFCRLNEFTPSLSSAMLDMLELQYELKPEAVKWYVTIDIAIAFFFIPLAAECRSQFVFTWRGAQYTRNRLPQGWKHLPWADPGCTGEE